MTDWGAFAGLAGVVVLVLLALARASSAAMTSGATAEDGAVRAGRDGSAPSGDPGSPSPPGGTTPADEQAPDGADRGGLPRAGAPEPTQSFGTGALFANVLLTHGLFAAAIAGAAVYWRVPRAALGVGPPTARAVALGVAVGVALYVANEAGAAAAARLGVAHDEGLRAVLAPGTASGWVVLFVGVLPLVAVAEELVFRGVLVGALAAGFGLPLWLLVPASSAAFALGHGAQGRGGVLVTGLLGAALAVAFAATGSLLVVVVAHYVVNALEFAVHEGLGVEWAD